MLGEGGGWVVPLGKGSQRREPQKRRRRGSLDGEGGSRLHEQCLCRGTSFWQTVKKDGVLLLTELLI